MSTIDGMSVGQAPTSADALDRDEQEEEDGGRMSDRLITELTAHRTLALRAALAAELDAAYIAVLHALTLRTSYGSLAETCLEVDAKSIGLGPYAPGLSYTKGSRTLVERHGRWQNQLPRWSQQLWTTLVAHDGDSQAALFAFCVVWSLNAVVQSWDRKPAAIAHADRLAEYLCLDMAADGDWTPSVDNYLGRVTKARIIAAVREAKGEAAAEGIAHLKKTEMAEAAEHLLAGTGWLPGPLRTAGLERALPDGAADVDASSVSEPEALPAFLTEAGEDGPLPDGDLDPALAAHAIAAD